jgi:hypothetical protein
MRVRTALGVGLTAVGLAACGGSGGTQTVVSPARLEHRSGSSTDSIVLSPLGAERIGIQTARVVAGKMRGSAVLPYAAVVYEPDGTAIVYTNPAPLTYTMVRISIAAISAQHVYSTNGPAAGTKVVTVGAEELLGVQNGVVPET